MVTPASTPNSLIKGNEILLQRLAGYSNYARGWFAREPALRDRLLTDLAGQWTTGLPDLQMCRDEATLKRRLRELRTRMMLLTMARDISGQAPYAEIVGNVTRLAAWAVQQAQTWHETNLRRRYGLPTSENNQSAQTLITVGMGKLGGEELNVSSDIDLIFVFPEDGETHASRGQRALNNVEFFGKVGAAMTDTLDTLDHDGFVFRVDTRLRPYGDEGTLAVSIDFLEQYLVEQGRFWERLAWLRSASITGDTAARKQLSALVRPFVYRRYLDYDAYDGLRDLHGKIRAEGNRFGGEANVKLGRGGIRELEFFVQVQQLVRGGRNIALQQRSTLPAIAALEHAKLFSPAQAQGLREAYPFLRRVEHFLQYANDEQTQIIPAEPAARTALAQAMDFASWDELATKLAATREWVAKQFDTLSDKSSQTAPQVLGVNQPSTTNADPFATWSEPEEARRYFDALARSQKFTNLPSASATRVQALLALLPATCGASPAPLPALKRWGDLIEAICGRSAYLALLAGHPSSLAPISRVLAASAWAAGFLRDHPILLDELIDARNQDARFDSEEFSQYLRRSLSETDDIESKLDLLRRAQQTALFRILLADLGGTLSVESLADDLSALADRVVENCLAEAWKEVNKNSSAPPLAVIAYGRWGGKELGYGSDLDWVFLAADDAPPAQCAKLVQRMQTWMSTLTAAGRLYETDIRLRPDGESGLPFSTVSAFDAYQQTKAWLWEHQALSRARFAVGDERVGNAFETIRRNVLKTPKTAPQVLALKQEISEMRARMAKQKANRAAGFDVKNDAGGMVDIEFIVQTLVLTHANAYPFLVENKGNIALLLFAGENGLLPAAQSHALADAYRAYRAFQHHCRLAGEDRAVDTQSRFQAERHAVTAAWGALLG
jgi:[glutamine synthetase] adenylyltransferase / [glutamine synthetase]-adenylyl-L-tyrosine phosphorylase